MAHYWSATIRCTNWESCIKLPGVPGGKNILLSEALNQNLLWQWQANPLPHWKKNLNGVDRFYAVTKLDSTQNLWNVPNLYMQKIPADSFEFTVKLRFKPNQVRRKSGLNFIWI